VKAALRRQLKSLVLSAVPRSRLAVRGPRGARRVALTFDDGPDDMTRAYLDVLDRYGARATFFVVGEACEARPELVREYVVRGHQVAGHGWDHTRFTKLDPGALRAQLARTNAVLGPQPTARPWVRPPYGALDARVLAQLLASGAFVAMWSLDSFDYTIKDPEALVSRCAPSRIDPGEVVLLHEGQAWTLDALPRILERLRDARWEMVTMAELLTR
jgi:peptidoglycan/xylan/chitin deacetylase (PgdA/CDA1 family)